MKTTPAPLMVRSGNGANLELEDGRLILDCISSWWVTIHGHGNEVIAKAIYEQAKTLEQVIFAGFTHAPAENLAKTLLNHLPASLKHIFFSDNGSTAVEVALKIALQYWSNQGIKSKKRFIGLDQGHHGDTVGAMSIGGTSPFWQSYSPFLFEIDSIPYPATWKGDKAILEKEDEALSALEKLLTKSEEYAGIVIEPLVQGAAGMRMARPQFLQALEQLAKKNDLLLIYDEVMTGFGRTGDWFACQKSKTNPDILCLSKGLTGGFLPLALTITSEKIYQAFYDDDLHKALFHSHSYNGNPIACAAANASLKLLEENPKQFMNMESVHEKLMDEWISKTPSLTRARICGTIAAFDLESKNTNGYFDANSSVLRQKFIERGFLIRPLGNTIYLLPPYCITESQLSAVYQAIHEVSMAL